MLPIVVMPPAIAAREPDQKSSTQIGESSRPLSPWCTRCVCASIPPGSASRPPAASSSAPVITPPSWAIRPSEMPMSAVSVWPGVTTVAPRITRSKPIAALWHACLGRTASLGGAAMSVRVGMFAHVLPLPRKPFRTRRRCSLPDWEKSSTARVIPPARPRKLAKAPFVELADGRLQGVVSSGSDIERVYVSSVTAGSYAFACSTNNNRPCGGARGSFCNHITALVTEAVLQYGADRVARYLRVEPGGTQAGAAALIATMTGARPPQADGKAAAAPVFRRFLRPLPSLDLAPITAPLPELHWSPPTRAAAATGTPADEPDPAAEEESGRLTAPVAGLDEALAAVDAFDRTLTAGLLRPRPDRVQDLTELARVVVGTP